MILFEGLKWEYKKDSYFSQSPDCQWAEYQQGQLVARLNLVRLIKDGSDQAECVLLYRNSKQTFIQICKEEMYEGHDENDLYDLLHIGKWIKINPKEDDGCVLFKKEMKWEYEKGFYFTQADNCEWTESQNGKVVARYTFEQFTNDQRTGIVLHNKIKNNFIKIEDDRLYTGPTKNTVHNFLYVGKWISTDAEN